jgi:UDP-N-acetylmuramoyl-tripeptide--D-alanyl-D-alanine ligase
MGTRGIGHIAALCEIARPTIAVVTNVGACHLELLGSLDGVARAKRELVEALPASGTAVLNAEDERVLGMAASAPAGARVVTYGLGAGDVRAVGVRVDDELRVAFGLESPWGATDVRLETRGAHQVPNALAAAAAALASGVAVEEIAAGLARTALSPWRMEVRRAAAGALVVNDAYNANPASVEAALHALARLPARRRIAVLGPMLELGDVSAAEHARVGSLARQLGIDRVFAVGAPAYGAEDVADVSAALDALGALGPLREGDVVLVKASRAAGLERLAAALVGEREEAAWSPS